LGKKLTDIRKGGGKGILSNAGEEPTRPTQKEEKKKV